jgi:hypothetical protein
MSKRGYVRNPRSQLEAGNQACARSHNSTSLQSLTQSQTRRCLWQQTEDDARSPRRRGHVVRRQFRGPKSVHHLRQGYRCAVEQVACGGRGRYGNGDGEEGEARVEEERYVHMKKSTRGGFLS